jgi:hypothetical protein
MKYSKVPACKPPQPHPVKSDACKSECTYPETSTCFKPAHASQGCSIPRDAFPPHKIDFPKRAFKSYTLAHESLRLLSTGTGEGGHMHMLMRVQWSYTKESGFNGCLPASKVSGLTQNHRGTPLLPHLGPSSKHPDTPAPRHRAGPRTCRRPFGSLPVHKNINNLSNTSSKQQA